MPEGFTIHGYAGAAPARRSRCWPGSRTATWCRWRPRPAKSCGRSRWPPRRTSSSTSTRPRRSAPRGTSPTSRRIRAGSTRSTRATATCAGASASKAQATSRADRGRLYFVAPRFGLHAAHPEGHVLWRQGLSEAGDLTHPMVVGQYLVFSGSRAGMFVVDGSTGELLEIFNPGHGVCASPTWDERPAPLRLSNSGVLVRAEPELSRARRPRRAVDERPATWTSTARLRDLAARFDAADQLFDPARAAGVARLPLDAEAVLAAGVAASRPRAPTAASRPRRRAAIP